MTSSAIFVTTPNHGSTLIAQKCVAVSKMTINTGITTTKQPREDAAHEGAVEQVERETDFAEEEEVAVGQEAAEVRGHDNCEGEELGADGGPEAR
ncbi:MAG: hypothetical protein Q9190_007287 [Brigantiaea leucoxantha]